MTVKTTGTGFERRGVERRDRSQHACFADVVIGVQDGFQLFL